MAEFEHFELGLHAPLLCELRHFSKRGRRGNINLFTVSKVQCSAVQTANLRQQILHVGQPLERSNHVGTRSGHRRIGAIRHPVTAHAGSQVDHHVSTGGAHQFHHLAKQLRIPRTLAGVWVAHVYMRNRGPRLGRIDSGGGNLLRRNRHTGMTAKRIASASYRAGHNHFIVHLNDPGYG